MGERKSISPSYLAGRAAILVGLLVLFYFIFPEAQRWRVIGIATAIAVVAFAGGYFLTGPPRRP